MVRDRARQRPLRTAGQEATDFFREALSLLDKWKAEGEIKVVVDVLGMKAVSTLHIPLPGGTTK